LGENYLWASQQIKELDIGSTSAVKNMTNKFASWFKSGQLTEKGFKNLLGQIKKMQEPAGLPELVGTIEETAEVTEKQALSIDDLKKKMALLITENKQGSEEFKILGEKILDMEFKARQSAGSLDLVEKALLRLRRGIEITKTKLGNDLFVEGIESVKSLKTELSSSVVNEKGIISGLNTIDPNAIKVPDNISKAFQQNMADAFGFNLSDIMPDATELNEFDVFLSRFNNTFQQAGLTVQKFSDMTIGTIADTTKELLTGGAGFAKSVGKMAFDLLDSLVPVWSAQILGYALATPDAIASLGATALIKWLALTGILKGAVAGARSALGFKEGSGTLTKGGVNDVAGFVHGQELVVEHGLAKNLLPIYSHLRSGGSEYSYFEKKYGVQEQFNIDKKREGKHSFSHSFNDVKIKGNDLYTSISRSQYSGMGRL